MDCSEPPLIIVSRAKNNLPVPKLRDLPSYLSPSVWLWLELHSSSLFLLRLQLGCIKILLLSYLASSFAKIQTNERSIRSILNHALKYLFSSCSFFSPTISNRPVSQSSPWCCCCLHPWIYLSARLLISQKIIRFSYLLPPITRPRPRQETRRDTNLCCESHNLPSFSFGLATSLSSLFVTHCVTHYRMLLLSFVSI